MLLLQKSGREGGGYAGCEWQDTCGPLGRRHLPKWGTWLVAEFHDEAWALSPCPPSAFVLGSRGSPVLTAPAWLLQELGSPEGMSLDELEIKKERRDKPVAGSVRVWEAQ